MSHAKMSMREWCWMCQRVSPIGFKVPDAVWHEVIHPSMHEATICVLCFAARADEKLVAWDLDIRFFPVSLRSHTGAENRLNARVVEALGHAADALEKVALHPFHPALGEAATHAAAEARRAITERQGEV